MVNAFWLPNHNFGDNLNHYLLSRLAKGGVVFTDIGDTDKKIVAIGTILGWCNENCIAWGPGLGNHGDCVNPLTEIRAVRGPRSRKRAIECGLSVPEVYGDPALLMPLVYRPPTRKTHALGIIPHYVDQKAVMSRYKNESREIRVIDILDTPERVAEAIVACDRVVSSSLHGIIVAHAYGIPAAWVEFGDKIGGDGMKYHDHFEAVGLKVGGAVNLIDLPGCLELSDRSNSFFKLEPRVNTKPLISASPFEFALPMYSS